MKKSIKTKIRPWDVFFKADDIFNEIKKHFPKDEWRGPKEGCITRTQNLLVRALKKRYGKKKAHEIAFHLTDWIGEGRVLVAFRLFPELFTLEEIEYGVFGFLIHAPNHVVAGAHLAGDPIGDVFELGISVKSQKPVKKKQSSTGATKREQPGHKRQSR